MHCLTHKPGGLTALFGWKPGLLLEEICYQKNKPQNVHVDNTPQYVDIDVLLPAMQHHRFTLRVKGQRPTQHFIGHFRDSL